MKYLKILTIMVAITNLITFSYGFYLLYQSYSRQNIGAIADYRKNQLFLFIFFITINTIPLIYFLIDRTKKSEQ